MNKADLSEIKKNIIAIGRLLWEKDLATGLNGNISARTEDDCVLLTATKTCLGILQEKDILPMTLDGQVLEEGQVSTEKLMHLEIYKNFSQIRAVIHTHTTFTNAYFLENDVFTPRIFEARLWFGEVAAIKQHTPSVTDATPVIEALRTNNISVLQNHGAVAMGQNLFDCFLLIQELEESIKTDALSRLYKGFASGGKSKFAQVKRASVEQKQKYKLFSKEQIDQIVRLVNADPQMQSLGEKTQMTMRLAVKCEETDQVYCFHFEKGRIEKVESNDDAEFVISASTSIWRAVFKRELDPFVATTQKKMYLKGELAKLSKWYAPCSRIFELWAQVPVE